MGYAYSMMIETNPENIVYGSFGEFDPYGTADWTDEDWAEYDAAVGQEIADWEAECGPFDEFMADDSIEPPF
jgi:hypothetical protein